MHKQEIMECLEEIKSCVDMLYTMLYTRDNGMKIDESLVKFAGPIQTIYINILELIKLVNEG